MEYSQCILVVFLHGPVGISTGKPRNLEEIKQILQKQETRLHQSAQKYGNLSEAYIAVQAGIAWNLISKGIGGEIFAAFS